MQTNSHHFVITLSYHLVSHRASDLSRNITIFACKLFSEKRDMLQTETSSYVSMMTASRERKTESHMLALKMCAQK